MTEIIAVIGRRRSGKSTLVDCIHNINFQFSRVTMMAPVMNEFMALHELTPEQLLVRKDMETNRYLMQIYSEERRKVNKDIFLNQFLEKVTSYTAVVVDDVYYYNELEALLKLRARIVLIDSKKELRAARGMVASMHDQPWESEVSTIKADIVKSWGEYVVTNDTDINSLRAAVQPWVSLL